MAAKIRVFPLRINIGNGKTLFYEGRTQKSGLKNQDKILNGEIPSVPCVPQNPLLLKNSMPGSSLSLWEDRKHSIQN